jgi:hypothetical protein
MSTITTTPAPSMSRAPLVIAIGAVGVLAVSAVAIPRIASVVGSSTSTTASSSAVITQHDLVEHRADIGQSSDRARATSAAERRLLHDGKIRAGQAVPASAALAGAVVAESTVNEQVGGLAPTFGLGSAASPKLVYNGRGLVAEAPAAAPAAASVVAASTLREQVGGKAPTFAYTSASGPTQVYNGRGLVQGTSAGTHTRWNDAFVPPYDDPEWMPVIKRHYAGSVTTPVTHEFH